MIRHQGHPPPSGGGGGLQKPLPPRRGLARGTAGAAPPKTKKRKPAVGTRARPPANDPDRSATDRGSNAGRGASQTGSSRPETFAVSHNRRSQDQSSPICPGPRREGRGASIPPAQIG